MTGAECTHVMHGRSRMYDGVCCLFETFASLRPRVLAGGGRGGAGGFGMPFGIPPNEWLRLILPGLATCRQDPREDVQRTAVAGHPRGFRHTPLDVDVRTVFFAYQYPHGPHIPVRSGVYLQQRSTDFVGTVFRSLLCFFFFSQSNVTLGSIYSTSSTYW